MILDFASFFFFFGYYYRILIIDYNLFLLVYQLIWFKKKKINGFFLSVLF